MTAPQVYLADPPFTLHPDLYPAAVPPPAGERSFRAPFGVDPWLFEASLDYTVPLTFASVYIVTVFALNAYNRHRNWKPWWVARQWWFNWFVVLHNAILTVYSAATFIAIARAVKVSVPNFFDPETTLASVADSICKMHGPRGLGDAVNYNTTINIWESKNSLIRTTLTGSPDPSDVGRIWNEGLAFWGWFFYMSKFYEVIDTAIIIAKGKRSATLQTYHHSGAMLCMWAGIRFMSPPIMMFVLVNSFIHALMYTYFTLSALGIRVPRQLKRALTTMQIAQFLWGATYASAHLFVAYDIPVTTSFEVASTIKAAVSSVSSAAAAASSGVSKIIESPAAITSAVDYSLGATFKKLLLRAAGEEGIAELVDYKRSEPAKAIVAHIEEKIQQTKTIFETHWRTDNTRVHCLDTSGEVFAIYLNVFYLAPLTFLFARFFVKAYTQWGKRSKTTSGTSNLDKVLEASKDAKKMTETAVEQIGTRAEEELEITGEELEAKTEQLDQSIEQDVKDLQEELRKDVESFKSGTYDQNSRNFASSSKQEESSYFSSENTSSEQKSSTNTSTEQTSSEQTSEQNTTQQSSSEEQSLQASSSAQATSEETASEVVSSTTHFQAEDEPESKQESNLESSQALRPGTEDDTDAMGKSGALVERPEDGDVEVPGAVQDDEAEDGGLLPPTPSKT